MTEYSLRIKSGWAGLPLKGMIIGHENLDVVFRGLCCILMMFEALTDEEQLACSHATLLLSGRGSILREQILCIVRYI